MRPESDLSFRTDEDRVAPWRRPLLLTAAVLVSALASLETARAELSRSGAARSTASEPGGFLEVFATISPLVTVGGVGQVTIVVENQSSTVAVTFMNGASIHYANGFVQSLALTSPISLPPGRAVVQIATIVIPEQAAAGVAELTGTAEVISIVSPVPVPKGPVVYMDRDTTRVVLPADSKIRTQRPVSIVAAG